MKNLNFEDVKKNDNGASLSNSNFKRADVPTEKAACDDTKDIESYKADCEDSSIRSADGEDELISTVKRVAIGYHQMTPILKTRMFQ